MTATVRMYAPDRTPDVPYQWQDDAACLEIGPEMFFPDQSDAAMARKALEVCATCPVIQQCRKLGAEYEFGVWGGTTPNMRRASKGPWRGSKARQKELAAKGMPAREIARLCGVTERTVHRTLAG